MGSTLNREPEPFEPNAFVHDDPWRLARVERLYRSYATEGRMMVNNAPRPGAFAA